MTIACYGNERLLGLSDEGRLTLRSNGLSTVTN